jgi:hypothetical protein
MFASARSPRPGRFVALALAAALALGACSGSGSSTTSSAAAGAGQDSRAVAPAPAAPDSVGEAAKAADGNALDSGAPVAVAVADRKIASTVGLFLTVEDVRQAAAAIRGVAAGVGGVVVNETVNATDAAPSPPTGTGTARTTVPVVRQGNYGTITLGIPSDRLTAALDQLAKLGVEVQRTSSTEDVTGTYVDLQARIDNMKASVAQARAYLAQAKDLTQMVQIEAEVTRRQSDLDSLTAQINALSSRVAHSTVTVVFSSTPQAVTVEDTSGFLGGLKTGWKAFVASAGVAATVVGALLPWIVALAIVGLPLWWWVRRRRAAAPAPAPVPAPVPAAAAGVGPATLGHPVVPTATPPTQE